MWFVVFAIATQLSKPNFNAWKCADEVAHTPSACTMKKVGIECPTWFDSECSHGMKHVTSIFKVTWTKMCWYHCIIAIGMCLTAKSEQHMEVIGWYWMQLLILHVHAMPCDLKHVLWICLMHLQLYNLTFYMLRGHTSCAYTWRCGMHVTWSALWLKLHQLVFHAFKLTEPKHPARSWWRWWWLAMCIFTYWGSFGKKAQAAAREICCQVVRTTTLTWIHSFCVQ